MDAYFALNRSVLHLEYPRRHASPPPVLLHLELEDAPPQTFNATPGNLGPFSGPRDQVSALFARLRRVALSAQLRHVFFARNRYCVVW